MPIRFSYLLCLVLFLFSSACSQSGDNQEISKPPAYVTNAEYVLQSLNSKEITAIAFQVKPVRSTACEHMYIEFGKKNAQGEWLTTNILYPGKNSREAFGAEKLNNQIHFAEVDGAGEYGVIAFGCKPYGRELKTHKGLMAEFKVDHGKLNYIGEVTLLPAGTNFATVYVVNRSKFAREKIEAQMPELKPYFHENIMEGYIPQLSKEQQAALDAFEARKKALRPLFDMRNQVADEYNVAAREWNDWMAKYGGPDNPNKTAQAERESLEIFKRMEALEDRIELHDKFIDEGRNVAYVKRYIFLLNDYETKKAVSGSSAMLEAADAHDALLKFKKNNP